MRFKNHIKSVEVISHRTGVTVLTVTIADRQATVSGSSAGTVRTGVEDGEVTLFGDICDAQGVMIRLNEDGTEEHFAQGEVRVST